MKKICLFDLDGTLTDPKEGMVKAVAHALAHFGIKVENPDELIKFIGPPLWDSFGEFYNFTKEETKQAVAKYREYYFDKGMYENYVYPGIIDILDELQSKGIELLIATSKPIFTAQKIAEHFGFSIYFSLIAGSELDGSRSKKSEVINYALNIADPQRQKTAIMLGDRKYDIIGAKETGITSVGVLWGYGTRAELEEAGAGYIVKSPGEITKIALSY